MKTVVDLVTSLKNYLVGKSSVAPVEADPTDSSAAYSIGNQFYISNVLYEATASISQHDALVVGTNIKVADNLTKQIKSIPTYSDMVGATSSVDGTHGLVPQPLIADRNKALFGDGTWKPVSLSGDYIGLYGDNEIQSATDLNTLTTVGNYYKEGTTFAVTNAPSGLTTNAAQFRLTVEKSLAQAGDTRQVITDMNDVMYIRSFNGAVWSAWKKLEGVIELTQTLAAGNTQVTFTDSAITANCSVNVQTDSAGLNWIAVDDSTLGTLIYTYPAQTSPVSVRLIIRG